MPQATIQALLLGLALLSWPLAAQAPAATVRDPLFLGSLGFRAMTGQVMGPSLEGQDREGEKQVLLLKKAQPCILWIFDARFPLQAREGLAALEDLRKAHRGELGVLALSPSPPVLVKKVLAGLPLGLPVLASWGLEGSLALDRLPACLILAPGGGVLALRQGEFDWKSPEGGRLLAAILAAWPPGPGNPSSFLSEFEEEVLDELNLARAKPEAYIEFLVDYEVHVRAGLLEYPGEAATVLVEGLAAAEEAIALLRVQKPLPELEANQALSAAARAWLEAGALPEALFPILEAQGRWTGTAGASSLGGGGGARRLVVSLIVGDGQPGRPGLRALFSPDYRKLGLYLDPRAGAKKTGALVYAWDFRGVE